MLKLINAKRDFKLTIMHSIRLLFCLCIIEFKIREINSAPIHLVADFPTFAFSLLAHSQIVPTIPNFSSQTSHHNHHSSSSNNHDSDDDSDELDNISPLIVTSNPNSLNQDTKTPIVVDEEANELLAEAIALKDDNDILSANNNNNNNVTNNSSQLSTNNLSASLMNLAKATTINNNRFHQHQTTPTTVRLANGQSYQFCNDSNDDTKKCNDENTICKLGACVCKSGYFSHPLTGGYCQSIRGWLNNCDSDHQCQAFNVELICDTKSHERPFCDCAEGLYFDQENHTCLPCTKNTIISSSIDKLNSTTQQLNSNTTVNSIINKESLSFRLCRPNEFNQRAKFKFRQQDSFTIDSESPYRGYSESSSPTHYTTSHYQQATGASGANLSDPLRIKTPLEVFTGAIILFTLFTVAWLFLQRMIHDCRSILRSLRNSEFAHSNCNDPNFTIGSQLTNNGAALTATTNRNGTTTANHHYFDTSAATNQAVARLFSNDSYGGHFTSIYQRDLAGVMVQHLTGNLSPSSTSHALALRPNGTTRTLLGLNGEQRDSPLYPIIANAQSRNAAAAAAAAQLILSPNHPAIAIIRAAAASNPQVFDTTQASLSSFYDPPPKYEEAIAQASPLSYTPPPPPLLSNTTNPTADDQDQIMNLDNNEQQQSNIQQSSNIIENRINITETNNNLTIESNFNPASEYETDSSEIKPDETKAADYNTNSNLTSRSNEDCVNNNQNHNNS